MNDEHSNAITVKKIDNKLQMVQGNNSVLNSYDKEKNYETDQECSSDFSVCLNNGNSYKCNPVMKGKFDFKEKGPFICNTCGKIFKCNSQVVLHRRVHTNERPYICSICSTGFKYKSQLNRHMVVVHSYEKPYACNICTRSFKHKQLLDSHFKTHMGEKNHKCNVCEKTYLSKRLLIAHQVAHSGFVCKKCYLSFKTKYLLKLHVRMKHSDIDEKKFKCEFCNKGFKRKSEKTVHLRYHTGERPFVCDLCGKSYEILSSLKYHEVSHTKIVKEQICTKCNANLCGAAINRHISKCKGPKMTILEERPYKCETCNKIYKTSVCLKVHTKTHSNPKSYNYVYAVHKNINLI